MKKSLWINRIKVLFLVLGLSACTVRVHLGPRQWNLNIGPKPTPQPTYTPNPTYTPRPIYTPRPTYTLRPTYTFLPEYTSTPTSTPLVLPNWAIQKFPTPGEGEISQFATAATASSQYSASSWSAMQAAGAPDTSTCGDQITAWASASSYGKDWLLLTYDQPVIPTRIAIYQTYHPGAVSQVEVVDEGGNSTTVYEADPGIVSQCPYLLEFEVKEVDTLVRSIRITIDQSNHNGWNEIDAVQLIGKPQE